VAGPQQFHLDEFIRQGLNARKIRARSLRTLLQATSESKSTTTLVPGKMRV